MDNLKLDAIGIHKCTLGPTPNCHQSGQRWQGSRTCMGMFNATTRVEPTIKVWSDVHGGSGL